MSFLKKLVPCLVWALVLWSFASSRLALAGLGDDLASPVTTPAKFVTVFGGTATLVLALLEDKISDPIQRQMEADHPAREYAKIGDYGGRVIPNAAYVVTMLFAGTLGNKNAFRRAEIMTLATLYSAGLTTLLKVTIHAPRPNDGNDKKSFPSGHTTTAFAFASVVGAEHGLGYGFLAYGLAGLVAYSRMSDNKHYLHDVVAGATIGTAYGLGIYFLRKRGGGGEGVALSPIVGDGAYGLMASLRF